MSKIETMIEALEFNRQRTVSLFDQIAALDDSQSALAFRPAPGRAHLAWQFMHIGITEELFASERLEKGDDGQWQELWPRFRGGSTPDEDIPSVETIREILTGSREHLLTTLRKYDDSQLGEIPPALAQRGWTLLTVLHVLSWHEAHHQGQAHVTFNIFKAQIAPLSS